jgi:dTMP kinase
MKGKFIVLYGINNIGKTTQAKKVIEFLKSKGLKAEYLKYPVYDLEPTGPLINDILRGGSKQKIPEEELQHLYTKNRFDFEPKLKEKLDQGIWIIAEDYRGTGIAWGSVKGADEENLKKLNAKLLDEDIVILMDGERFLEGKEKNHIHESDDELVNKVRQKHLDLAKEFGWFIVNANQSEEKVFEDIKKYLEPLFQ